LKEGDRDTEDISFSASMRPAPSLAQYPPARYNLSAMGKKRLALIATRVIYCGDNVEQLAEPPFGCVDLSYIDQPSNSSRNHEAFRGEIVR
jgi:hypothetical protein